MMRFTIAMLAVLLATSLGTLEPAIARGKQPVAEANAVSRLARLHLDKPRIKKDFTLGTEFDIELAMSAFYFLYQALAHMRHEAERGGRTRLEWRKDGSIKIIVTHRSKKGEETDVAFVKDEGLFDIGLHGRSLVESMKEAGIPALERGGIKAARPAMLRAYERLLAQ